MNKTELAGELVRIAKSIMAATKDLAEIKAILPAMREKLEDFERRREEMLRESNRIYHEATRDVEAKTIELTAAITRELVAYFKDSGKGVRKADDTGGLVEVFIGSEDGVERYQSKVSVHIALAGTGRGYEGFMLRNEVLDDIKGNLSDKDTIGKLIREVKKADKKGFWNSSKLE